MRRSTHHELRTGASSSPVGFWERLASRTRSWSARHPRLVRRLRFAWLAWTLGSLALFLVSLAVVPGWQEGMGPWLWGYAGLFVLFVAARTKTVSWRFVALTFSAGLVLAPLIGLFEFWFADRIGAAVEFQDGSVLVAGPVEETLKLVPLLFLMVFARRRVRGFATVDFLLLGYAAGLGFQVFEDGLRRLVTSDRPPGASLAELFAQMMGGSTEPHYGNVWLPGGWHIILDDEAFFAGHAVLTGLVAAAIGMGLRLRRRLGPFALVLPLVALTMVVVDHAMVNYTVSRPFGDLPEFRPPQIDRDALPEGFDLPEFPWDHEAVVPGWIERAWQLWGRGRFEATLLVGLLALGMVLDVRRTRRAAHGLPALPALGSSGQAPAARGSPGGTAGLLDEAFRSIGHTIGDVIHEAALTCLALGRDPPTTWAYDHQSGTWSNPEGGSARYDAARGLWLYVSPSRVVTASATPPGAGQPDGGRSAEPSRRKRWLVAMTYLRTRRRLGHELEHQADLARYRTGLAVRLAWAATAVALAAAVLYALYALYGSRGTDGAFLANILRELADWWDSLSFTEQVIIVVVIAGALSFGVAPALGLAWGFGTTLSWVGTTTVVAEYGHGLADLVEDPRTAIDDYFDNLTPQQAALDAFTLAVEIPTRGHAPTGSIWRRQIDDLSEPFIREANNIPGGTLWRHEGQDLATGSTAHTLRRHIGQTDTQLAQRLSANTALPRASSFNDLPEAQLYIDRALESNRLDIDDWLATNPARTPADRLRFQVDFPSEDLGRVLTPGATASTPGHAVFVVLEAARQGSGLPYVIVTAYPTPGFP